MCNDKLLGCNYITPWETEVGHLLICSPTIWKCPLTWYLCKSLHTFEMELLDFANCGGSPMTPEASPLSNKHLSPAYGFSLCFLSASFPWTSVCIWDDTFSFMTEDWLSWWKSLCKPPCHRHGPLCFSTSSANLLSSFGVCSKVRLKAYYFHGGIIQGLCQMPEH